MGGREYYALSWLLEASSPVIANRIMAAALAAAPGTTFSSVHVPSVPGLDAGRQYALFGMAVEWLYTGGNVEPPQEALVDLWAMAAVLQVCVGTGGWGGMRGGVDMPTDVVCVHWLIW